MKGITRESSITSFINSIRLIFFWIMVKFFLHSEQEKRNKNLIEISFKVQMDYNLCISIKNSLQICSRIFSFSTVRNLIWKRIFLLSYILNRNCLSEKRKQLQWFTFHNKSEEKILKRNDWRESNLKNPE